jgi:hypothetical protein
MKAKKIQDYDVILRTWGDHQYFQVEAKVARSYHELDGLVISCQTDRDRAEVMDTYPLESLSYAWRVGLRVDIADEETCKRGARVLRRINRQLDAWHADFGAPQSFGMFLKRVLKALGADAVEVHADGDALDMARVGPEDAGRVADRAIRRWLECARKSA